MASVASKTQVEVRVGTGAGNVYMLKSKCAL